MISRLGLTDRMVTGILAGAITVVLLGGIVAAVTVNPSGSKPDKLSQTKKADAAAQARQAKAAQDAQKLAAANSDVLKSIIADQELCKTKYLAAAQARATEATQQLKEQEDALRRILDQLPPGTAKDTLAAQLPDEIAASNGLIASELQAAEARCRLAATVYQYTQAEAAAPPG